MNSATPRLLALLVSAVSFLGASSHREAPAILSDPQADITDFYAFRSYEEGRDGAVVFILNSDSLLAPGGPNYYQFAEDVRYDINIDNDGDSVSDITFRFRFQSASQLNLVPVNGMDIPSPFPFIRPVPPGAPITGAGEYTVEVIRGDPANPTSRDLSEDIENGVRNFLFPYANAGTGTIPNYDEYVAPFTRDARLPGCGDGRVFAGPRDDGFYVDLGGVFDLANLVSRENEQDSRGSNYRESNVQSIALEVPVDCLTEPDDPIIGAWATTSRPNKTFLDGSPPSNETAQLQRVGNPLFSLLGVGYGRKNQNAAAPASLTDALLDYYRDPPLARLLASLNPGVQAPASPAHQALFECFLMGIRLPDGTNLTRKGFGDMLRLNTSIAPTPLAQQNNLGFLGGDMAGFPNGRRPGDDVVDIFVRKLMGRMCHPFTFFSGVDQEVDLALNSNMVGCNGVLNPATGLFDLRCNARGFPNQERRGEIRLGTQRVCQAGSNLNFLRCQLPEGAEITQLSLRIFNLLYPQGLNQGRIRTVGGGNPSGGGNLGFCTPAQAPDGLTPFSDGASQNGFQFNSVFPYLRAPKPNSPQQWEFSGAVYDENGELRGNCEVLVGPEGTINSGRCDHNIPGANQVRIGETIFDDAELFDSNRQFRFGDPGLDPVFFAGNGTEVEVSGGTITARGSLK